jgi:LPS-assembly lipoprotein
MTWKNSAGTLLAVAAVALAAQLGGGCRPMYGTTSLGASAPMELASVSVSAIPGRVGQRIRNELLFRFTGGSEPATPQYQLAVNYRESNAAVLVKRNDDASGFVYSLDADYILKTSDGKTELMSGRSHSRAAYDKNASTFSNVRAQVDAENRAARDVATDINTKVAAYIAANR